MDMDALARLDGYRLIRADESTGTLYAWNGHATVNIFASDGSSLEEVDVFTLYGDDRTGSDPTVEQVEEAIARRIAEAHGEEEEEADPLPLIAAELRAAGIDAHVTNTGGGVMCVVAEVRDLTDVYDARRWVLTLGRDERYGFDVELWEPQDPDGPTVMDPVVRYTVDMWDLPSHAAPAEVFGAVHPLWAALAGKWHGDVPVSMPDGFVPPQEEDQ